MYLCNSLRDLSLDPSGRSSILTAGRGESIKWKVVSMKPRWKWCYRMGGRPRCKRLKTLLKQHQLLQSQLAATAYNAHLALPLSLSLLTLLRSHLEPLHCPGAEEPWPHIPGKFLSVASLRTQRTWKLWTIGIMVSLETSDGLLIGCIWVIEIMKHELLQQISSYCFRGAH